MDATQHDMKDPVEAIIRHSSIPQDSPVYSSYGHNGQARTIHCTRSTKGIEAMGTILHVNQHTVAPGDFAFQCWQPSTLSHQRLCLPSTHKKTGGASNPRPC